MCSISVFISITYFLSELNTWMYKWIGRMTVFIIKVPRSGTMFFQNFDIRFMNPESTLKVSSRDNIIFKVFQTGYKIYDISTFTVHLTFNVVYFTWDFTLHFCASFLVYHGIFAAVALLQLVMELCRLFLWLECFDGERFFFRS